MSWAADERAKLAKAIFSGMTCCGSAVCSVERRAGCLLYVAAHGAEVAALRGGRVGVVEHPLDVEEVVDVATIGAAGVGECPRRWRSSCGATWPRPAAWLRFWTTAKKVRCAIGSPQAMRRGPP